MKWTHRIYVKSTDMKRFQPIDGEGGIAGNLIYAAMFDKETAKQHVEDLSGMNPDIKFQVRAI